jgi:hypothetical protein
LLFLILILLVILLRAPIKAFPSEIKAVTFNVKIAGCGRAVTGYHSGRSMVALATTTYESGACLALVGTW